MAASRQTCVRPPTSQAAWVHQIHAAGGASSSTTMLMVFDVLFELFVRFLTRDSSVVLVVRKYILEVSQSGPPRLAPYRKRVHKKSHGKVFFSLSWRPWDNIGGSYHNIKRRSTKIWSTMIALDTALKSGPRNRDWEEKMTHISWMQMLRKGCNELCVWLP